MLSFMIEHSIIYLVNNHHVVIIPIIEISFIIKRYIINEGNTIKSKLTSK